MRNKLLLICLLSLIVPILAIPQGTTFIDGISLQGIDVSGMTTLEAQEKLKPYLKDVLDQEIIILSPDQKQIWLTTYRQMGLGINLENVLEIGLATGNTEFIFKRWWQRWRIKQQGYNIPLQLDVDEDLATEEIMRLSGDFVKEPQDARIKITLQNKVEIEPEVSGVGLDMVAMLYQLKNNLSFQGPISIIVQTVEVKADTKSEDLKKLKIETLLGQYTTWFNPQKKNRSQNIKMATKALNNYYLGPSEEFSFNEIVGPRTKEAGYNDAPIILNNKFATGIGGGVCQVSSTLYNVLLRSNLQVIERHPHSLPVDYVPKGMDAAVVYGFKDLKFINNTNGHVLIKAYPGDSSLTIKIFGSKEDQKNIEVLSIVEKEFMPKTIVKNQDDLAKGQIIVEQNGEPGYIVRVERIVKDNKENVLIYEILSRDYYPPIDKVILTAKS